MCQHKNLYFLIPCLLIPKLYLIFVISFILHPKKKQIIKNTQIQANKNCVYSGKFYPSQNWLTLSPCCPQPIRRTVSEGIPRPKNIHTSISREGAMETDRHFLSLQLIYFSPFPLFPLILSHFLSIYNISWECRGNLNIHITRK